MSQVSRQIAICPGLPRRLRVEGRKLCLCGPGGGGPTCGLCYGRALTGHPYDQCGGLFAPHQSLGLRFRVERVMVGGGNITATNPQIGQTQTALSNGVYSDSFTVGSVLNGTVCQPAIFDWVGSGSSRVEAHSVGGGPPYNGEGLYSGPPWEIYNYGAPLVEPIEWFRSPFYLIGFGNEPCNGEQFYYCGYAYPQPRIVYALGVFEAAALMLQRALAALPPGEPFIAQMAASRPFIMEIEGGPTHTGWFGQPCAGFFDSGPSAAFNLYRRETWGNTQTALMGRAQARIERGHLGFIGDTLAMDYTWASQITITPLQPCPGDSPENAALIAAHMARGVTPGCCD